MKEEETAFGHPPSQLEVAAGKTISREPVLYVRNIYKYYVAYKKMAAISERRQSLAERRD